MVVRKSTIRLLAVAAFPVGARLAFDVASAAAYVYPEFDFGQKFIAFMIFILAVPSVLLLALVRLSQRRLVDAGGLMIVCCLPFLFDEAVDRQFWKFRIHKSEYQAVMRADPGLPPKYRTFSWGNRNTQLMGGGVILEAIVYDESDDIGRWSPEWIERPSSPSPEDQWITAPRTCPPAYCHRRKNSKSPRR